MNAPDEPTDLHYWIAEEARPACQPPRSSGYGREWDVTRTPNKVTCDGCLEILTSPDKA